METNAVRVPWYVFVFRILLLLFLWVCFSLIYYCLPFVVDNIVASVVDDSFALYADLLLNHLWVHVIWIIISVVSPMVCLLRSLARLGGWKHED